ncbi:MAG: DUF4062 domain-containing protein [Thermodesulfobacteriota bacterium]
MVSSTFYDLRQIRADLSVFIGEHLGYSTLLSEFPSFPVDPDANTVENCCRRVEENADILVLIVGGRYGSVDQRSDKSITNLEYLQARKKGIPIYVFIDKQILAVLPVWKKSPDGDYSAVVDTSRLFVFVEEIRTTDSVWTFPFETAQDIITTLRLQLAHLFADSLAVRNRLFGMTVPGYFDTVSGSALRLLLEKPDAWEYRLFAQTWLDEVNNRRDLIRDYEAQLCIGPSESVEAHQATSWILSRLKELENLIGAGNHLLTFSAQDAFGPSGQPGDPAKIVWTSQRLGAVLENLLSWVRRILCARVEEPFNKVVQELAKFPSITIHRMQVFPKDALAEIDKALQIPVSGPREVKMTFTFELGNLEPYEQAFEEAKQKYQQAL